MLVNIKTYRDYLDNMSRLPQEVQADTSNRITDWLHSGGSMSDPYVLHQFKYASEVLNNIKSKEE